MSQETQSTTKRAISKVLAEKHDIPQTHAYSYVDSMIDIIIDAITDEQKVMLTGLATFDVEVRDEREFHNPRTGEPITTPSKKVVNINLSKRLADKVAELPVGDHELD